jgi:hypothetical protein
MNKKIVVNCVYAVTVLIGLRAGFLLFSESSEPPAVAQSRITSALTEMQTDHPSTATEEAKSRVAVLQIVAALAESRQCAKQQTWLLNKLSQSAHVEPGQVLLWLQQSVESGCSALNV